MVYASTFFTLCRPAGNIYLPKFACMLGWHSQYDAVHNWQVLVISQEYFSNGNFQYSVKFSERFNLQLSILHRLKIANNERTIRKTIIIDALALVNCQMEERN